MIHKVILRGSQVADAEFELKTGVPPFSKRLFKALTLLCIMVPLTVLAVLIPLLHFFLVPVMVIVTCIVVLSALKKSERIESSIGTCPYCKSDFLVFAQRFKLPIVANCQSCHRQVSVIRPD